MQQPFGPIFLEDKTTVLALIIGFVLIALMLWKLNIQYFSVPYWRVLLRDRSTRIEENQRLVEEQLAEASRVRDDYARRLREIEREARERIDAAVREAQAAHAEIVADAHVQATALKRRSEEEIDRERARHRIQMRRQIVQIALDAAERAVTEHNTEAVQRQLIGEFIAHVGAHQLGAQAAAAAPGAGGGA